MRNILLAIFLLFASLNFQAQNKLPEGFVYIDEMIPGVVLDIRYAGSHNFTGRPVPGYRAEKAIISEEAGRALAKVQQELIKNDYILKIFDAYRPQQAVDSFVEWARIAEDTLKKQEFYPDVAKSNLFEFGYIASKSGHSRGSTVDLSLVDAETCEEIDMGGSYDFFGERSHHDFRGISAKQKKNREILRRSMMKYGFRPYSEEWWHYTLRNEPFADTYFNFPVE